MPNQKTPLMKSTDGGLTFPVGAGNPFDALLPEDRLRRLQLMPAERRQEFYGRVVNSVFSDPAYQELVFSAAQREFDGMTGAASPSGEELRTVVQEVVEQVLRSRGR